MLFMADRKNSGMHYNYNNKVIDRILSIDLYRCIITSKADDKICLDKI